MGKPVPLLTSATLERLEREAWSQLTFPQLRLYILQKRVKRVWLVIFYASFPTRIETCPKTFKTLILFVVCVGVCVYVGGRNGGTVFFQLSPFPSIFVSCLLLRAEELFIELLCRSELDIDFHGCLVGQLFVMPSH